MLNMLETNMRLLAYKIDSMFKRVFKEQAGGAEIIATIVIVAAVLVIALIFRDKITSLVSGLWNSLVGTAGNKDNNSAPTIEQW